MDKSEGKDWFAKTLNSVTEETAKIYKVSRLKFELSTIAKAKSEKLNLMGRKVIEYINEGKIDAKMFEPEYSTIMKLEEKKNNMEKEIDDIRGNIKIAFGSKEKEDDVIKIIGSDDEHIEEEDNNDKKRRK